MNEPQIVLVDDNEADAERIAAAFASLGIRVTHLQSADELLPHLAGRERRPRLVLIDLNATEDGGAQLLQSIRNDAGLQTVPVIALASSGARDDQRVALQNGASGYQVKPAEVGPLLDVAQTLAARWLYAEAKRIQVLSVDLDDAFHDQLQKAAKILGNVDVHRATKTFDGYTEGQVCMTNREVAAARLADPGWNSRFPVVVLGDDDWSLVALGAEDVIPARDVSPSRLASAIHGSATRFRLQHDLDRQSSATNTLARRAAEELSEPARQVSSIVDILLRSADAADESSPGRDLLPLLKQGSTKMQMLTRDLLLYTQECLPHRPVDLNDAFRRALSSSRFSNRDTKCVTRVDTLPKVQGCAASLVTAFQNLIENAFAYRATNRQLVLEVSFAQRPGGGVTVCVSDNGKGIRSQNLDMVFEPLRRLDVHGPGTGLGLAFVRRCMERHGGTARLVSEVDVGTTVLLDFPSRVVL